jgi:hypothetical protein
MQWTAKLEVSESERHKKRVNADETETDTDEETGKHNDEFPLCFRKLLSNVVGV